MCASVFNKILIQYFWKSDFEEHYLEYELKFGNIQEKRSNESWLPTQKKYLPRGLSFQNISYISNDLDSILCTAVYEANIWYKIPAIVFFSPEMHVSSLFMSLRSFSLTKKADNLED